MKTIFKLLAGLIVAISISNSALAQPANYGDTPDECKKQLSFLKFGVEGGDMDAGLAAWRELTKICPQGSPNIYVWSNTAIEDKISKAKSAEEKGKYVDTLLMNYDLRLQHFPQRFKADDVALRKAVALTNNTPDRHEQILSAIEKYLGLAGDNADVNMISQAFQQVKLMHEKKQKTTDDVMSAYDKYSALIDSKLAKKPNDADLMKVKGEVDGMFITIPELSSCDNLIAIYQPKFEANKTDAELLKKIVFTLEGRKCQESQLFSDAAEALYKVEPSEKAAMALVTLFILKEDYNKAIEYLNNTINIVDSKTDKSKLEMQLATLYLTKMNNSSQAMKYARAAIADDPTNGNAQMIIATVYAKMAAGSNCGELDSKAVFWVVVDAFNKAKQLDPSIADEVNKSIYQFSQYFPTKEDIFMNGLSEGGSYTVNCGGLNERTTVRARR